MCSIYILLPHCLLVGSQFSLASPLSYQPLMLWHACLSHTNFIYKFSHVCLLEVDSKLHYWCFPSIFATQFATMHTLIHIHALKEVPCYGSYVLRYKVLLSDAKFLCFNTWKCKYDVGWTNAPLREWMINLIKSLTRKSKDISKP